MSLRTVSVEVVATPFRSSACSPHCSLSVVSVVLLALLLGACSGPAVAPLGRAPPRNANTVPAKPVARIHRTGVEDTHQVRAGDSLYSIAWRYGLDYRSISRWNGIAQPFTIYPGQVLRLSRPRSVANTAPLAGKTPAAARQQQAKAKTSTKPKRAQAQRSIPKRAASSPPRKTAPKPSTKAKAKAKASSSDNIASNAPVRRWQWPVKGRVIGSFAKAGGKGIDIAGSRGRAIKAAASGQVVYSGSGLRGYGMLIIVKHNKRYLSAYAHNERLHVKEGDIVKGGQRIADMGDSGAKSVRLHFEIRRDGKPVDPTRFLPK